MHLNKEIFLFCRWVTGVSRKFICLKPKETLFVVFATALKGVLQLLAFMVPLKVILLAASPGMPRYLDFVDSSDKSLLIICLAIGAVVIYMVAQLLGPTIDFWSRRAGQDLLRQANDLPLSVRDQQLMQSGFADFTGILAGMFFLVVTVFAMFWLNRSLLIWLFICGSFLYAVSRLILRGDRLPASPIKSWLVDKYKDFIGYWEAITFFGGFAIILWPFLEGGGGSVFLPLVSFILIRRMVIEFGGVIRRAVGLARRRQAIDGLLYRGHVLSGLHSDAKSALFNELFSRSSRDRLFSQVLLCPLEEGNCLASQWLDPSPPQVKQFLINLRHNDQVGGYLARIYGSDLQFQADHESFLLRHVTRSSINAATPHTRCIHHDYLIVFYSIGCGNLMVEEEWRDVRQKLALDILALKPPPALVRSYQNTHAMLADRLTDSLFERLSLTLDADQDAKRFEKWMSLLPALRQFIRNQPVALVNPDLVLSNVLKSSSDDYFITYWGRWRLEPLGAAVVLQGVVGSVNEFIEDLKVHRQDLAIHAWRHDLEISALCFQVELAVKGELATKALRLIASVLDCWCARDAASKVSSSNVTEQT